MNREPVESLKGIGEKTGKLFQKIGIVTVEELLAYYPRAYDTYREAAPLSELKPEQIATVAGMLYKTPDVKRYNHIVVITATLKDSAAGLQLVWYNMPYLHTTLKAGMRAVFLGKVTKKKGRLLMEQPEVFTEEEYRKVVHSMQPVYGQTKGLSNKVIVRAAKQALSLRQMSRDYIPANLRRKHQLAEYNFAVEHIHFPADET